MFHHHHHLECEGCGDITEFERCPLELRGLPDVGDGFEVRAHSAVVYGTCPECR